MDASPKATQALKEHSALCLEVGYRQRCDKCRKSWINDNKRARRQKQKDSVTRTRSGANKNKSKYAHLLCDKCQNSKRTRKDMCRKCYLPYYREVQIAYRKNKYQLKIDSKPGSKINIIKNVEIDKAVVKHKSKNQPEKSPNDKRKVSLSLNSSKNKKDNHNNKSKKRAITPKQTVNTTPLIKLDKIDNADSLIPKVYSDSTIEKEISLSGLNKLSPRKRKQLAIKAFKKILPLESRLEVTEESVPDFKEHLGAEVFRNFKEGRMKTSETYNVLNSFSKIVGCKNVTAAKKLYKIGYEKAKNMVSGETISRKIKEFSAEKVKMIEDFYTRDDISRVSPNVRECTQKHGPRRYMRFPFRVAYKIFQNEHPTTRVSFSKFHELKPENIWAHSKMPLLASLCCYCQNVNLKLQAIKCPGLDLEYDLFDLCTCQKEDGNELRNIDCMYKDCPKCKDWVTRLRNFIADRTDLKKEIIWLSWVTKKYEKNGKISVRRVLISSKGTIDECINNLVMDDLNESQKRCNFFVHFYGQVYQQKMYQLSLKNLKAGSVHIIQDFSRNRDVFYQFEIKSSYWTRKQISMHPSVIYFKDVDGSIAQRMVLTHLSDITNHDAHIVHYITIDCIQHLINKFPDTEFKEVIIWSDGCSSQYKGKHSFYYLNKLQTIFPQLKIQRNYFGSEHGKGESDAETGIYSKQIRDAVKSESALLSNASEMCNFLAENNKENRIFKEFTNIDLKSIYEDFDGVSISTLSGNCTRALHQIAPTKKIDYLLTRRFSCFCESCTLGEYDKCKNKSFTLGKFKRRKLPTNLPDIDSNSDEEDDDENTIHPNDEIFDYENLTNQIEVQQEEIEMCNLNINDFIITSLSAGNKLKYYVAQIQGVDIDNDEVIVDYLEQHYNYKDIFIKTEKKM